MNEPLLTLSQYSRIIVSGCQRSGTTFVSKILAQDLGYACIDENDFGVDSKPHFLKKLEQEKIVIHCPALSHILQEIQTPDSIIVWVSRPYEEIRASMRRINWDTSFEALEKKKYLCSPFYKEFLETSLPIEELKTLAWKERQVPALKVPHLEIEYHSEYVKQHPLHIPKARRGHFAPKQTKL